MHNPSRIEVQPRITLKDLEIVDALLAAEKAISEWKLALEGYEQHSALTDRTAVPGLLERSRVVTEAKFLGRAIQAVDALDDALFQAMNTAASYTESVIAREWMSRRQPREGR